MRLMVLTAVLTAILAGTRPQPVTDRSDFWVVGAGTADCAQLTINMRDDPKVWQPFYANYIDGFTTGANYHAALVAKVQLPATVTAPIANAHVAEATSTEALFVALQRFCVHNPLQKVSYGLGNVYNQLALK